MGIPVPRFLLPLVGTLEIVCLSSCCSGRPSPASLQFAFPRVVLTAHVCVLYLKSCSLDSFLCMLPSHLQKLALELEHMHREPASVEVCVGEVCRALRVPRGLLGGCTADTPPVACEQAF